MNIVLFEDHLVEQLFPITLTRPAYAMTCGSLQLVDLAKSLSNNLHGVVRDYMADFQADYFSPSTFDPLVPTLWLNARLVPDADLLQHLRRKLRNGEPFIASSDGHVTAALTVPTSSLDFSNMARDGVLEFLTSCDLRADDLDVRLIDYPHTLIAEHTSVMVRNLEFRLSKGSYCEVAAGVFSSEGTPSSPHVVFDAKEGPIVMEEGVSLGAFSAVNGPTYLGRNVQVAPHAFLKGPICVGHTSKVGGEVSRSVLEPYSNKVHFGYLGTAYIGSWVNLGAGTTNSNLKNTYGSIRVEYDDKKVDTGMQFLGCVVGDFTKTAIHASIYTGKILGACSNVYGTVTTNVPSFSNYARSFGEVTEHPAEIMIVTQKRVFERRGIEQEPRHVQLLRAIYEIEAPQRKLVNHPPSL